MSEHVHDLGARSPEVNEPGGGWACPVPDVEKEGRERNMAFGSVLSEPSRARGGGQMMKQLFS